MSFDEGGVDPEDPEGLSKEEEEEKDDFLTPRWFYGSRRSSNEDEEDYLDSPAMRDYQAARRAGLDARRETRKFTSPQMQRAIDMAVDEVERKLESGEIPKGNVELAALMGSKICQLALGMEPTKGISSGELIQRLIDSPDLKVFISKNLVDNLFDLYGFKHTEGQ